MSASNPKATESLRSSEMTLSAKNGREHSQQRSPLFNHLIGAGEQRRGNVEAEGLSRLEVDYKFERGRLLDWNICGFRPAQNLVDEIGSTLEQVPGVWPIGQQARFDVFPISVHSWQPRAQCQSVDSGSV